MQPVRSITYKAQPQNLFITKNRIIIAGVVSGLVLLLLFGGVVLAITPSGGTSDDKHDQQTLIATATPQKTIAVNVTVTPRQNVTLPDNVTIYNAGSNSSNFIPGGTILTLNSTDKDNATSFVISNPYNWTPETGISREQWDYINRQAYEQGKPHYSAECNIIDLENIIVKGDNINGKVEIKNTGDTLHGINYEVSVYHLNEQTLEYDFIISGKTFENVTIPAGETYTTRDVARNVPVNYQNTDTTGVYRVYVTISHGDQVLCEDYQKVIVGDHRAADGLIIYK